ncbi:hypothetical protein ACOMHN_035505 [Nucella lapillus]
MASASAPASHLECPVCHEGFTQPKLLPCTHLVCRKCVVSWLEKGGDQNGCPLCRAPIVPDSAKAQGDFASQVDALPTDFATAAVIESTKMLNSGHVCSCCDDVEAIVFCLQCAVKFCDACAKTHAKIPATRDHVTEKLSDLSAEQLALHHHVPCVNHQAKQAELYCSNHEQVICVLCASSAHRKCGEVEGMGEVAQTKREELRAKLKKLEQREAAITKKINKLDIQESNAKTTFKAMKNEVKATFGDLRRSLDVQEKHLNSQIQQREETYLANQKSQKLDLENHMAAVSAHKSTAERVVSAAPDSALLGMLGKLKSRLDALESQVLPEVPEMAVGRLVLDQDTVRKTKEALAAIGRLTDPSTAQQAGPDQLSTDNNSKRKTKFVTTMLSGRFGEALLLTPILSGRFGEAPLLTPILSGCFGEAPLLTPDPHPVMTFWGGPTPDPHPVRMFWGGPTPHS